MVFFFLFPIFCATVPCSFEAKSFMTPNMSLKLYVRLEKAQNQLETLLNTSHPADTARISVCESDGQPHCTSTEKSLWTWLSVWYSPVFHKRRACSSLWTDQKYLHVKKCSYIPWTVRKYFIFFYILKTEQLRILLIYILQLEWKDT